MENLGPEPRYGIIGGSGVQVEGQAPFKVETPFGVCFISCFDEERRVCFANRHLCTGEDPKTGKPPHQPPHLVNYKAMVWALCVHCKCSGIVALGSAGTLHPEKVPVGCVVMPDDYFMVVPEPMTFWGTEGIGMFSVPEGGHGCMHYVPADPSNDKTTSLRRRVQKLLTPVLAKTPEGKVKLARGQTPESWPLTEESTDEPSAKRLKDDDTTVPPGVVYVNSIGPRFETRAEIRSYRSNGHVVGMTCAKEWALCEELQIPYCLICVCDNACNGLSLHPKGAFQEYLDHKKAIGDTTAELVKALVAGLVK